MVKAAPAEKPTAKTALLRLAALGVGHSDQIPVR
jgi:hypothetical protein